ncbi:type II toxin-antitoxin system RelE family toxin [Chitinophaga barathri]|uniref:Type II toxin-antitoxin system RelE/ParE family toxin n=1 Tax=Chitinophaga barathri TaxID=1647451 RepID=A0A3N4MNC5_9BACT|nr:type II toxin-antitoxin system RelE/ParE family toxin [Chitinophaga barathri]
MYRVSIQPRVLKLLERMDDPGYTRIKTAIAALAFNPRPHGYRKLKGREGYRIRVGDYRVIYTITDFILSVEVLDLGHRNEIYNQ